MKWTDEKIEMLKDGYKYMDLNELANQIGCTVKALTRKAEAIRLFRAKNNDVNDGYKYCTFCKTYHPILDEFGSYIFHKDRHANNKFKYYCKKYNQQNQLNDIKSDTLLATPPLNQKRGKSREKSSFLSNGVKSRPRNPIVIRNGVEGKICNGCKVWKPLSEYGADKRGIAGKRARCVVCMKERVINC
mgnify:CR=1 FL=1